MWDRVVDSNNSESGRGAPVPDEFDESEIDAIAEFLGKQGGLGLLIELGDEPRRFVTLKEAMGASPATIRKRLEEARELNLVDDATYNSDGHKLHPLTQKGTVIYEEIRVTDLPRIQRRIWELQDELTEEITALEEELVTKTPELNKAFARKLTDSL